MRVQAHAGLGAVGTGPGRGEWALTLVTVAALVLVVLAAGAWMQRQMNLRVAAGPVLEAVVYTGAGEQTRGLLRWPDGRWQVSVINDAAWLRAVVVQETAALYGVGGAGVHRMNVRHPAGVVVPGGCFGADGWADADPAGWLACR